MEITGYGNRVRGLVTRRGGTKKSIVIIVAKNGNAKQLDIITISIKHIQFYCAVIVWHGKNAGRKLTPANPGRKEKEMSTEKKSLKEIVTELRNNGMRSHCDLDNWQPELDSGHFWVCRIHKEAKRLFKKGGLNE